MHSPWKPLSMGIFRKKAFLGIMDRPSSFRKRVICRYRIVYYFTQNDLMEFLSPICNSLVCFRVVQSCVGVEGWFGNEKDLGCLERQATTMYGFTREVWEIICSLSLNRKDLGFLVLFI